MSTTPAIKVRPKISWMLGRDLPDVMSIEAASFDFPWAEEEIRGHLRQYNCIGMVATADSNQQRKVILGFMIYELQKTTLEILDFAVHPHYRRMGVGTAMVDKLKGKLSSYRRTHIHVCTRETNLDAQLFFRSQGFVAHTVLREHYGDTGEDAYRFAVRFIDC